MILEANHVNILDMMLSDFVLTGKNYQLISPETLNLLQTPNIGNFRVFSFFWPIQGWSNVSLTYSRSPEELHS